MSKIMTFEELIKFLDMYFPEGALIKITDNENFADQFLRGEICLGTLEHFRKSESKKNGRGDPNESIAKKKIYGIGMFADGQDFIMTYQDVLTGLCLCMFHYENNESSKKNLKKCLKKMGCYINVFSFNMADALYWNIAFNGKLVRSVSGLNNSIPFRNLEGNHMDVRFTNDLDYSGFTKLKSYDYQQEYRYIFSLEYLRNTIKNIDSIDDCFIFKINQMSNIYRINIIK